MHVLALGGVTGEVNVAIFGYAKILANKLLFKPAV
jgi:hypothetical protein